MSIFGQAVASILDNYADVIEGGNAYNSGTSFRGIAGTRSVDQWITQDGTFTTSATGDTTSVVSAEVPQDAGYRFARDDGPPYFLRCLTATNSGNVGATRKVTAYSPNTMTTAAFPATVTSGDTFRVHEGFRRMPDNVDIEDDEQEAPQAFDRYFQLSATPGVQLPYYGKDVITYTTIMELRLRLVKHARERNVDASVMENLMFMRSVLTRGANPDHRDGTYTRALQSVDGEAEIIEDDQNKVVAVDRYVLIYRVSSTFL